MGHHELRTRGQVDTPVRLIHRALQDSRPSYIQRALGSEEGWRSKKIRLDPTTQLQIGYAPWLWNTQLLGLQVRYPFNPRYGLALDDRYDDSKKERVVTSRRKIRRFFHTYGITPEAHTARILFTLAEDRGKLSPYVLSAVEKFPALVTEDNRATMYTAAYGKMVRVITEANHTNELSRLQQRAIKRALQDPQIKEIFAALKGQTVTLKSRIVKKDTITTSVFLSIDNREIQIDVADWFKRELVTLPDGKKVEAIWTPHESVVVPITEDGHILLVKRKALAQNNREIITVLSAANPHNLPNETVAEQALNKLAIPGVEHSAIVSTGLINAYKYSTADTNCYTIPLPRRENIQDNITIVDEKTEAYLFLTEEQFYEKIDNGEIIDLRTIVAVQFALAARKAHQESTFSGDEDIVGVLGPIENLQREFIDEVIGKDWFPREVVHGEEVVSSGHQVQAVASIDQVLRKKLQQRQQANKEKEVKEDSIVFLVEPYVAQGKTVLTLPGGEKEKNNGAYTAIKELFEETGFIGKKARRLAHSRNPLPLYFNNITNECYAVKVVKKGQKRGGDESQFEQGTEFEVPVSQIGWYIKHGYITDAAVIASLLDWGRQKHIAIL